MSELKLQQCRLDGRYDILDCLGRGSYSEVYVARDVAATGSQPQMVVIKALNPALQGAPDADLERTLIENFRNEAIALDRVRHPNIISRLGHGTAIDLQSRTFHYLVLEYLPGGDMQAHCRQHPLSLADALNYLEQVCAGLQHAHKHGVIHRDIKPQNLLLTANHAVVKIADFGVAKIEAAEGAITRVGTDLYAAPEHHPLAQTGPLDTASLSRPVAQLTPAADIYSLGKTTYMLLTGEAPRRFTQKPVTSLPDALAAQAWAQPIVRVLERATRTNPERRYQSVEEFWNDLKRATLPHTRGNGAPSGDYAALPHRRHEADEDGAPAMPPPPTFEKPVEPPRGRKSSAQRIVVPVNGQAQPPLAPDVTPSAPVAEYTGEASPAYEEHAPPAWSPRTSSRTRTWLVAILLIVAFAGMLYATHVYMSNRAGANQPRQPTDSAVSPLGREFITTTDVNLRNGPTRTEKNVVGLAEKDSVVRVSDVNGSWYYVSIVEHGRPKEKSESADEGWLHKSLLREK